LKDTAVRTHARGRSRPPPPSRLNLCPNRGCVQKYRSRCGQDRSAPHDVTSPNRQTMIGTRISFLASWLAAIILPTTYIGAVFLISSSPSDSGTFPPPRFLSLNSKEETGLGRAWPSARGGASRASVVPSSSARVGDFHSVNFHSAHYFPIHK
jgi:hypothetical protein